MESDYRNFAFQIEFEFLTPESKKPTDTFHPSIPEKYYGIIQ